MYVRRRRIMDKRGKIGFVLFGILEVTTCVYACKKNQENLRNKDKKINKFKSYYNTLNEWLRIKHKGVNLEKYFIENGYKNVAIYGMGEMGNRLYEELMNTEICVKYAIDKNALSIYSELQMYEAAEDVPPVDVIVVTATFAYDEIVEELQNKVTCPIVSLEDVVYEI